jgi:benzylsuccinate CoA-transferase BbsF subunit
MDKKRISKKRVAGGIFDGLRVIELALYAAVPTTGRVLASMGAEVILIQSNTAIDEGWLPPPWGSGLIIRNRLVTKKSVSLNVRKPEAHEILKELIGISDIFMTNLTIETLKSWGLDFHSLKEMKDDLIILWQNAFGGIGPYTGYRAYGMLTQYSSGVAQMSGTPEMPASTDPPYSDLHTAMFGALAVVSAIERRRRTGKGTLIECVLNDTGVVTAGPAILNYQANGILPVRMENKDLYAAPHGAYPCRGYDRWCLIAVSSDAEWLSFCSAIGNPPWTKRREFATLTDRLRNVDELDRLVAAWTINREAAEVMEMMQAVGVPAGIVAQGMDLVQSEHLKSRGYYKDTRYIIPEFGKPGMEWAEGGPIICISEPIHFSETPCRFYPMPRIGQDNEYVFGELLGIPPDKMATLTKDGVLE